MNWIWEKTDPLRSGSSGDLSKLFRNEAVKQPGSLAVEAPSPQATTMAREVIQNSWDAARELQDDYATRGLDAPDFQIDFEFRSLRGDQKQQVANTLDLESLAERTNSDEITRRDLGLSSYDCLLELDTDAPLEALEIRESGNTGMYGPFTDHNSKMYLALITIGYTRKNHGAGGSYGYGKAGLIRGSATRTIIAYSCFEEQENDRGVTRRLLGMTYWGPHELNGKSYTGFARLGEPALEGATAIPFENDKADEIAAALGMEVRSADLPEQLGTTFLLLDPTVNANDLRYAIERNWWPALIENDFAARVIDADGLELWPKPRQNHTLRTFIRAYELATVSQDNAMQYERSHQFEPIADEPGGPAQIGRVGLVADPDGWSYADTRATPSQPDELDGSEHRSLVALVRGPRMVVEYWEAGRTAPYVRGTVVAHDDVDDLLRQTEPALHDAWMVSPDEEGIDPAAPRVAKAVLDRTRTRVNQFRRELKPPIPKAEDVRLPVLQDLFKKLLSGQGRGRIGPEPDTRPVTIGVQQRVETTDDPGSVVLTSRIDTGLSAHESSDSRQATVAITYKFVEDGRAGEECELSIEPPEGFEPVEGKASQFTGELTHNPVTFRVRSKPYSAEWTGRLVATAELLGEATAQEEEE